MPLRLNQLVGLGKKPLVASVGYDEYTSAIWHFNDSTQLTDSSDFGNDLTAVSSASVSATQKKFGDKSLSLSGSNYAKIDATLPSELIFGTGDFTIDYWIRMNDLVALQGFFTIGSYVAGVYLRFYSTTQTDIYINNSRTIFSWTPSINTWYHHEISRSGSTVKMFVDGVQIGTQSNGGNINPTGSLEIGTTGGGSNAMNAYFDEFRISKGIARHTTTFTPETGPYGS